MLSNPSDMSMIHDLVDRLTVNLNVAICFKRGSCVLTQNRVQQRAFTRAIWSDKGDQLLTDACCQIYKTKYGRFYIR